MEGSRWSLPGDLSLAFLAEHMPSPRLPLFCIFVRD